MTTTQTATLASECARLSAEYRVTMTEASRLDDRRVVEHTPGTCCVWVTPTRDP